MENSFALRKKDLGLSQYSEAWQAMRDFTDSRTESSEDQLWFTQHHPVFTQGQAGKAEHILNASNIPLVQTDRGGQVTYHGPGQLVTYFLLNLKRRKIGVRDLVTLIENSVIELLNQFGLETNAKPDAPGVYVDGEKIASLGLRIRKGCSYHGVSINVDMDLSPFSQINPCGYPGMHVVDLRGLVKDANVSFEDVQKRYDEILTRVLA